MDMLSKCIVFHPDASYIHGDAGAHTHTQTTSTGGTFAGAVFHR